MKKIILLGSTGSVGRQTLEVIREARDFFKVVGLSANQNETLLKQQAKEFGVKNVIVAYGKNEPLVALVENIEADLVIVAVSGVAGVLPTLAAIRSGKNIALANKETLVMAGELVMKEVKKHGVRLIPIDSEHNAIFQLIQHAGRENVEKIILPCSGGPFLGFTSAALQSVTPAEALRHPTWSMGPKISIDSATTVNKGFEVIEAHHLFSIDYDRIEVVIHPECHIHGMVQLRDGRTLVYAAPPDMKTPIRHALGHALPAASSHEKIITLAPGEWLPTAALPYTLHSPDHATFPGIRLGYEAGRRGGVAPKNFVLANDAAVADFLAGTIKLPAIYDRIKGALRQVETRHP